MSSGAVVISKLKQGRTHIQAHSHSCWQDSDSCKVLDESYPNSVSTWQFAKYTSLEDNSDPAKRKSPYSRMSSQKWHPITLARFYGMRMDTCMCLAESVHCSPETISTLLIGSECVCVSVVSDPLWTPLVQFSCSVASNSLRPHVLEHARLPRPSPTPRASQTHVHWVSHAIQPSHPLSSPSPPAFSLSQHQGLFQWVSSLYQMVKIFELQLYWDELKDKI